MLLPRRAGLLLVGDLGAQAAVVDAAAAQALTLRLAPADGADIDLEIDHGAAERVAMHAQLARGVDLVAAIRAQHPLDEALLEAALGLRQENAALVKLADQRFQFMAHGAELAVIGCARCNRHCSTWLSAGRTRGTSAGMTRTPPRMSARSTSEKRRSRPASGRPTSISCSPRKWRRKPRRSNWFPGARFSSQVLQWISWSRSMKRFMAVAPSSGTAPGWGGPGRPRRPPGAEVAGWFV